MKKIKQLRDQFRKLESSIDKIDELELVAPDDVDNLCELYDTLTETIVDICRTADVDPDSELTLLNEAIAEDEESVRDYFEEFRDRIYHELKDNLFCNIFDIR